MIVAAECKVSRCLVALQGETSLPLDSMFPPSDFRRTGEGNGNEEKEGGEGEEEEEKKEATLYLPLTERTEEETIVEYEVEYKLS